jgi:uncharacterized membrane protein HdeD (DUF308 family)
MEKKHQLLLIFDGIVNVILGIILFLYPFGADELLDLL